LLQVDNLRKSLPVAGAAPLEVARDISFTLHPHEFVSIVGPSGAGKTTLLRTISGLIPPDDGTVQHRGEQLRGVPAWLAIVFQEYNKTLFPWLSVRKNVQLAIRRLPGDERERKVHEALERVGLSEFASRYPWELSGGMQQRVAVARALVAEPELLLMDEPFASVDALTRTSLEEMVQQLWQELGFAALLVTHDISEAVYLSDRVLVVSARPASVIADVAIDLARPRDRHSRGLPRFHELCEEILGFIEAPSRTGTRSRVSSASLT
jgi:NitT/TauT family transport system ATP-binding protein